MRCGIVTPIVRQQTGLSADWERDATVADLEAVARAADALGYHHLTCSEHVAIPRGARLDSGAPRGVTYWDPLATLSYLAAVTARIRLLPHVVVLGYHHPLAIAKRYGTLDVLSGGRTILGVGVGTLRTEFELLGAPFDDRGSRADDAIRALRVSLSTDEPTYQGDHYGFAGFVVEPHAVQAHVPIWVGGRSIRSLRRAVDLADGWVPVSMPSDVLRRFLSRFVLPPDFAVVTDTPPIDPASRPGPAVEALDHLREIGATHVNAVFVHRSRQHYIEQLEALRALRGNLDWSVGPAA